MSSGSSIRKTWLPHKTFTKDAGISLVAVSPGSTGSRIKLNARNLHISINIRLCFSYTKQIKRTLLKT